MTLLAGLVSQWTQVRCSEGVVSPLYTLVKISGSDEACNVRVAANVPIVSQYQ